MEKLNLKGCHKNGFNEEKLLSFREVKVSDVGSSEKCQEEKGFKENLVEVGVNEESCREMNVLKEQSGVIEEVISLEDQK